MDIGCGLQVDFEFNVQCDLQDCNILSSQVIVAERSTLRRKKFARHVIQPFILFVLFLQIQQINMIPEMWKDFSKMML